MKMQNFLIMIIGLFVITSSQANVYNVSTNTSKVNWEGKKLKYSHKGELKFESGSMEFSKGALKACSFVVNMETISSTESDSGKKAKLDGHLKNEDFFHVKKHPKSTLKCGKITKKGNTYSVDGILTVKNIPKPVKFVFENINVSNTKLTAKTNTFTFNRLHHGVTYASKTIMQKLNPKNWMDKIIKKDISLQVDLVAEEKVNL